MNHNDVARQLPARSLTPRAPQQDEVQPVLAVRPLVRQLPARTLTRGSR